MDVNRASQEELQTLPGIGPVLARRIVDRRTARPFRDVEELTEVKGIGEKRLARLRPLLTVSAAAPGTGPAAGVKGKL